MKHKQYKLNIGDPAPDHVCQVWPEGEMKLSDFRGRWVVAYFYPKDQTPGCTAESCEFRDFQPDFADAGAVIVGISRDSVASHRRFAEKHDLPFTLVADTGEELCQAFDVIHMKNMYGKQVRGIERSTFLIDPQGIVAHVWRKVRVAGHVKEVLQTLQRLQQS